MLTKLKQNTHSHRLLGGISRNKYYSVCLDLQRRGRQVWILEEMLLREKRERELSKAERRQATVPSDLREGREGWSEHSKMHACVCVCVCVCVGVCVYPNTAY